MLSDLDARRDAENFEPGTPSLRWDVIRDYHVRAFARVGYPPETWTAWIPLHVDGDGNAPGLWHRMVTEDFLTVAVQTVWLVAGRAVHRSAAARHGRGIWASAPPSRGHRHSGRREDGCMHGGARFLPALYIWDDEQRASRRVLPHRPCRRPCDDGGHGSNRTHVRLAVQAASYQFGLLRLQEPAPPPAPSGPPHSSAIRIPCRRSRVPAAGRSASRSPRLCRTCGTPRRSCRHPLGGGGRAQPESAPRC